VRFTMPHNLTFRGSFADEPDADAIRCLACDRTGPLPEGPVLFAEIDGHPIAVIGIADGRTVSDPDRATAAVRTRLRLEWLYVRLVLTVWGM
jgi:hypothetical protein